MTNLSPPPYNAQTQALPGLLVQLHSEWVPQVFLLVLRLVPVDRQTNPLRRLPEHVDGFIVTGCTQVNAVHLWRERKTSYCLYDLKKQNKQ